MAPPMVTVTGTFTDASGAPLGGTVKFIPVAVLGPETEPVPVTVTDTAGSVVLAPVAVTETISAGGTISVTLAATDTAGLSPSGWCYQVIYRPSSTTSQVTEFCCLLPGTPSTADFSTLVPVTAGQAVYAYLPETGGTMSGPLILAADPTASMQAATKHYVDENVVSGAVSSVNTQTGAVVLTAADVGADASGAAASAQTAAESFATSAVSVETSRAETAEALALAKASNLSDLASAPSARSNLGLGSAALQSTSAFDAAGAATTAQSNAETFATSAVATETSRAEAAEALLAPLASPALTGSPTAPTKTALTSSTDIATTAYADSAVAVETSRAETAEALKAPLASPALTGTPTAPTATALTDSTQVATTAYADSAVAVETSRAETAEALKLAKASNLSDVASQQTALNNLAGAVTSGYYLRGGGTNITMSAIAVADLPAATTSAQGAVILDGTSSDIQALGTQAAGNSAKAAAANHVHPTTGLVTGVTAGDTSIVVGGTSAAPTIGTATLDVIAADHPPAANWSNNSHKITSLASGSATTDAVNVGQVPLLTGANTAVLLAPSGATGVTFDRGLMGANSGPANTHTTLYARAIALPSGLAVNNITFMTGNTAQNTGTHGWYCLLDSGLVVRAVSADQTSTYWTTTSTVYTLSVSASAYTTTYTGLYYIGFCTTSTTEPIFQCGVTTNSILTNIPPILMGYTTGQTTPPSTGTTMGSLTGNAAYNFLAWTS